MRRLSDIVYLFLHFCSRWMLRILYPSTEVDRLDHTDIKGPYILSGNHPNTLIDPLFVGIFLSRRLHFMAHAGLFQHKLMARFLAFAGVVPIARAKDRAAGMEVDNNASFSKVYELLERGEVLYIAPEGGSELERKLRPLKSGLARLALQAEAQCDWQLGLKVLPAVINYESPSGAFSRAYVRYAPPIIVADWRERFEKDPTATTRAFTQAVREQMENRLIQTQDKTEEHTLRALERCLQNDRPLSVAHHHERVRRLLLGLRSLSTAERSTLSQQAAAYEAGLQQADLNDLSLSQHPRKGYSPGLVLGFPIFLYGWVNHWLLLGVIKLVERMAGIIANYRSTLRGLVGVVFLPIVYLLQSWLFGRFFPGGWSWVYLFSLPVTGLFALAYWTTYRPAFAALHRRKISADLSELRASLRAATDRLLA